jgi:hypothetical protein
MQWREPFSVAGGTGGDGADNETVAVFQERVAHETEFGLFAPPLTIEPPVPAQLKVKKLLSTEHFSVDGTDPLLAALAMDGYEVMVTDDPTGLTPRSSDTLEVTMSRAIGKRPDLRIRVTGAFRKAICGASGATVGWAGYRGRCSGRLTAVC